MKESKKLSVSAIKEGTVIDHIPAENLFKVLKILNLQSLKSQMTFGTNLDSKKLGLKAIVKVSNKFFEDKEVNKIALVAPDAQLNIIKNYEVVEKKDIQIPENVVGIVKCVNPKCITNHDEIVTRFTVVNVPEVALKCHYCEKITDQRQMKIII